MIRTVNRALFNISDGTSRLLLVLSAIAAVGFPFAGPVYLKMQDLQVQWIEILFVSVLAALLSVSFYFVAKRNRYATGLHLLAFIGLSVFTMQISVAYLAYVVIISLPYIGVAAEWKST